MAVTGAPGAGKSVLLDFLTKEGFTVGYQPPGRSINTEKEKIRIKDKKILLTTIPGQTSKQRTDAIDELFDDDGIDGVIHVVSYGYRLPREFSAEDILVGQGVLTIENLRILQLKEELEDLEETCDLIRSSFRKHEKPKWMIILVHKVDLYSDRLNDAFKYYSPQGSSDFIKKIQDLQSFVGKDNFEWDSYPLCTCVEDFSWNGEVSKTQFNTIQRDKLLISFQKILGEYCVK